MKPGIYGIYGIYGTLQQKEIEIDKLQFFSRVVSLAIHGLLSHMLSFVCVCRWAQLIGKGEFVDSFKFSIKVTVIFFLRAKNSKTLTLKEENGV